MDTIEGEVVGESTALAIQEARANGGLAISFDVLVARVKRVDQFYREVMQDGTDYGTIPGTPKPTLLQPGAQLLDQIFGLCPVFEVMPSSVIDWQRQPVPFFHYIVRCRLMRGDAVVAEGVGSCNSWEDKYRWRTAKRTCPSCGQSAIIKGKAEFGGGWLCFKKQGGCGAKFRDGDQQIEGQPAGRVENDDTASLENTILKMASKRAHVAATLNATGASRIFTQDVEDLPDFATGADDEPPTLRPQRRQNGPAEPSEPVRKRPAPPAEEPPPDGQPYPPDDEPPAEPEAQAEQPGFADTPLRRAAIARYRQLAAVAKERKHKDAGKIGSMDPATMNNATLKAGVMRLEEMFPDVTEQDAPAADDSEGAQAAMPLDETAPFAWGYAAIKPDDAKTMQTAKCHAEGCNKVIGADENIDFAGQTFKGRTLIGKCVQNWGHPLCPVHYREYGKWESDRKAAS